MSLQINAQFSGNVAFYADFHEFSIVFLQQGGRNVHVISYRIWLFFVSHCLSVHL